MHRESVQTESAKLLDDCLVMPWMLFFDAFFGAGAWEGIHLRQMLTRAWRLPFPRGAMNGEQVGNLALQCRLRTI